MLLSLDRDEAEDEIPMGELAYLMRDEEDLEGRFDAGPYPWLADYSHIHCAYMQTATMCGSEFLGYDVEELMERVEPEKLAIDPSAFEALFLDFNAETDSMLLSPMNTGIEPRLNPA